MVIKRLFSIVIIINILLSSNIYALAGTWPSERHDQTNSAFLEEKIFPQFREKWSTYFPGYTPVYANNTLYYNDGTKIYAWDFNNSLPRKWFYNIQSASLTPAVDGNLLYFGYLSGKLTALEDNNFPVVKWQVNAIESNNPVLVTDNYVIVNGSKTRGNKIMAFDKANGTKLWEANLYEGALEDSLGVGAPIRDGNHIIVASKGNLYCFNISNGARVWGPVDTQGDEYSTNGIPVIAGDNVIIKTPQNKVRAFNKNTGALKWETDFPSVPIKTGVVKGNNIYYLTDNGILTSLNINDGGKVWSLDLNLEGGSYGFNGPPILVGRIIYFLSQDGTLFAVESERGYVWWQQQFAVGQSDEFPLGIIASDGKLIMSSGIAGYKVLEQDLTALDNIKPLIYDEKKLVGSDITITAKIEDNLENGVDPTSIVFTVDGQKVPQEAIAFNPSTNLFSAFVDGFGAGQHQATLQVADKNSNYNGLTWDFYQDTEVPQISLTPLTSTDYFIDNKTNISFDFVLSKEALITAKIIDENNNIVKTLIISENKDVGTIKVNWDGKDDNGNLVSNGEYHLEVKAEDSYGNEKVTETPTINVHTKIENFLTNLSISRGDLVLGRDEQLEISCTLLASAQVKAEIVSSFGNVVKTLQNGSENSGGINYLWNLKDEYGNKVPAGNYFVRVMGVDTFGNGIELKTNFSVNSIIYNLVSNLNINPEVFIVGGNNKTTISYNLAADANVTVTVEDYQGRIVATILDKAEQKAGLVTLPLWSGREQGGKLLFNGEYILNVTATAKNGDISHQSKGFDINWIGDQYEDNDTLSNAMEITPGQIKVTINPIGDVDFYKIHVPQNQALNILLESNKEMDGVLDLFNENGDILKTVNHKGTGGFEKIGCFSSSGEYYYIRVKDKNSNFSTDEYTLKTSVTDGDIWEINEVNKQPLAIRSGLAIKNRKLEYYNDVDEYLYTAPGDGTVQANLLVPNLINGVVTVINKKTGKKTIFNKASTGKAEIFTFPVKKQDVYIFQVSDFTGEKSDENYNFTITYKQTSEKEVPLKITNVKWDKTYSIKSGKKYNISFVLSKGAEGKIEILDSKNKVIFTKAIKTSKGGSVLYSWQYTGTKKELAKKPIGNYSFIIRIKDKQGNYVVYKGLFKVTR